MKFNLQRAIERDVRRGKLNDAEQNGAWVIRKRKTLRERSKNELDKRQRDSATCFHGNSYTMKCRQCRRSEADAIAQRARIAQMLSNQ